jgi:hypothetical protein
MTLDQLLTAYDRGSITSLEFVDHTHRLAAGSAADAAELMDRLGALAGHPDEWVRSLAAAAIQSLREIARRRAEQVKDVEVVRRTSRFNPAPA